MTGGYLKWFIGLVPSLLRVQEMPDTLGLFSALSNKARCVVPGAIPEVLSSWDSSWAQNSKCHRRRPEEGQ